MQKAFLNDLSEVSIGPTDKQPSFFRTFFPYLIDSVPIVWKLDTAFPSVRLEISPGVPLGPFDFEIGSDGIFIHWNVTGLCHTAIINMERKMSREMCDTRSSPFLGDESDLELVSPTGGRQLFIILIQEV